MSRYSPVFVIKLAICVLFIVSLCWSDSLTLRDGRHIEGKYVGGSAAVIGFVTNGAVQYFPVTDVMTAVFGEPGVDSPLGTIQQNSYRGRSRTRVTRISAQLRQASRSAYRVARLSTLSNAAQLSPSSSIPAGDRMYRLLAAGLITSGVQFSPR